MRRLVALVSLFIIVGALAVSCGPKKQAAPAGGAPAADENAGATEE